MDQLLQQPGTKTDDKSNDKTDETVLLKSDQNFKLLQGFGWAEEENLQTYNKPNGRLQNEDAHAMQYINTKHGLVGEENGKNVATDPC